MPLFKKTKKLSRSDLATQNTIRVPSPGLRPASDEPLNRTQEKARRVLQRMRNDLNDKMPL
jgi:hypothetical protein